MTAASRDIRNFIQGEIARVLGKKIMEIVFPLHYIPRPPHECSVEGVGEWTDHRAWIVGVTGPTACGGTVEYVCQQTRVQAQPPAQA